MTDKKAALPALDPYVTAKGGVVILNGPFPLKEAERIAALCRAAPDLLNALKLVQAIAEGNLVAIEKIGFDFKGPGKLSDFAKAKIDAAIAKAEGRS